MTEDSLRASHPKSIEAIPTSSKVMSGVIDVARRHGSARTPSLTELDVFRSETRTDAPRLVEEPEMENSESQVCR